MSITRYAWSPCRFRGGHRLTRPVPGSTLCTRRALNPCAIMRRAVSNSTGSEVSTQIGHGEGILKEQTGMLYLDNMFPLKMNFFDIRQILFATLYRSIRARVEKFIPSTLLSNEIAIKDVIARTKDGGAVVTFSFKSTDEVQKDMAKSIITSISDNLSNHNVVAPFNFQSVRAFRIKGEPFMEDILARYPSPRLRVEFQGDSVPIERLYKHFRQYGRIFDIALYPNPVVAKEPSRYAIVQFTRVRSATSAKTCLHGHTIHGTRMNILYERQLRTNIVKDWLVNHPRISVPLGAALAAGVTYVIFEPIRVFSITSKITQRFNPEEYAIYRWLRSETWARLMSHRDFSDQLSAWADDPDRVERLASWLREKPDTFICVSGPKSSGKSGLVKAAIKDRRNKIVIDCEDLANASNKSDLTRILAKQVGYFPVFTWMTSMNTLLNVAVAATTGQKETLSSSPDAQIKNILETVAIAVRNVIENAKHDDQEDQQESVSHRVWIWFHDLFGKPTEVSKNNNNEAKRKEDLQESIPIIVLDKFMYRDTVKNDKLWSDLAEWAALLVENEMAHVVFVSSNVSLPKVLSKALPGKTFSSIVLTDAPLDISMSFITKQLGADHANDPALPEIAAAIGGRMTELEVLVQKMTTDMDAQSAFEDIVQRNLGEIRKYGFGDVLDSENQSTEWTTIQFWDIVKRLNDSKTINYDEVRWSPLFDGSERPLRAMERAELITIVQDDGRPNAIRAGKPIFYTVFERLVSNPVFAASMDIETNTYLKKSTEDTIAKIESKIESLSQVYNGRPPREIDHRIRYLLGKVAVAQSSIEKFDADIKAARQTIETSWKK